MNSGAEHHLLAQQLQALRVDRRRPGDNTVEGGGRTIARGSSGKDLDSSGIRADIDPNTNQWTTLLSFTGHGAHEFQRITKAEYQRGKEPEDLLAEADRALYEDKENRKSSLPAAVTA